MAFPVFNLTMSPDMTRFGLFELGGLDQLATVRVLQNRLPLLFRTYFTSIASFISSGFYVQGLYTLKNSGLRLEIGSRTRTASNNKYSFRSLLQVYTKENGDFCDSIRTLTKLASQFPITKAISLHKLLYTNTINTHKHFRLLATSSKCHAPYRSLFY